VRVVAWEGVAVVPMTIKLAPTIAVARFLKEIFINPVAPQW
jgi:hypothetical protein